jgi:hypothetical protein
MTFLSIGVLRLWWYSRCALSASETRAETCGARHWGGEQELLMLVTTEFMSRRQLLGDEPCGGVGVHRPVAYKRKPLVELGVMYMMRS